MSSSAYIANADGTSKVYFDIDPTPLPIPKYEVVGAKKRTLNTRDINGNIIPGQWHHYTGGTHITGATLDVQIPMMTRTTFDNIIAKITGSGMGEVQFSPDGTTVYNCVFAPGEIAIEPIEGTELLAGSLKFNLTS